MASAYDRNTRPMAIEKRRGEKIREEVVRAAPALTATEITQIVKKTAYMVAQNRSVFIKRHDKHILKWISILGLEAILQSIEDTEFTKLDYFYTEVDDEICMWEKLFLDRQLSEYEDLKDGEYQKVNPAFEEVAEKKYVWNKEIELKKLQDRHGPRSPEAREFARKWGMVI